MNKKNILIILGVILVIVICVYLIYYLKKDNSPQESEIITETEQPEEISLDSFYTSEITDKYKDIRELDELYNSFDAQKDNCFVVGAMVHNDYLYGEFMDNYNNKKEAFIRVVQNTTEGDTIIYDVKYDANLDKVLFVQDTTRDKFSSDQTISLKEFNYTGEYEYENHLYWVLYNEPINDENFNSENTFILVTIN